MDGRAGRPADFLTAGVHYAKPGDVAVFDDSKR
jgi:hypothetical protein